MHTYKLFSDLFILVATAMIWADGGGDDANRT